jgi:hypothetical protein
MICDVPTLAKAKLNEKINPSSNQSARQALAAVLQRDSGLLTRIVQKLKYAIRSLYDK